MTGPAAHRVLLADAHAAARASVRELVDGSEFSVCAEAASAEEAVDLALRERPQICLIEVFLPGSGIGAMAEITERLPHTAVIALTNSTEPDHLFAVLRAGASGYLLKSMGPERLPHALRGVLAGEAPIPRALVTSLVSEFRSQGLLRTIVGKNGRTKLTAREWEVLGMLAAGLSTEQIADRLHLAPVTVRRHVGSVVRKLGVRDREAAVALVNAPGPTADDS